MPRFWITAHYPPIKGGRDTFHIYIQNQYKRELLEPQPGDKVFIYEFKSGPGVRNTTNGVKTVLPHEPGAEAVVCEAEVITKLEELRDYVPQEFIGKGIRNYKWRARTGNRLFGHLPRVRVNQLLGYGDGHTFFGFNHGRGIKQITPEQYSALHDEFVRTKPIRDIESVGSRHTLRSDGRSFDQLRVVKITRNFTTAPAGSVLWQQGGTIVLCTASVTQELPPWFSEKRAGGWVTADYVMLPGSTPRRKDWPKIGHTDSRGTEIQRIIGRSLRAAIDLTKIGPHTIALDCQVLQADGGTRTASICAAYVALVDAIGKLPQQFPTPRPSPQPSPGVPREGEKARYDAKSYDPQHAIVDQLAAVSVGIVDGEVLLDLDYNDDSRASVDTNVAYTAAGKFVEVQSSAENGAGFDRAQFSRMMDLAVMGCGELMKVQRKALEQT
jgi:ribonuclease PH